MPLIGCTTRYCAAGERFRHLVLVSRQVKRLYVHVEALPSTPSASKYIVVTRPITLPDLLTPNTVYSSAYRLKHDDYGSASLIPFIPRLSRRVPGLPLPAPVAPVVVAETVILLVLTSL